MPIEIESPEQMGYSNLKCNLTESSVSDVVFKDLNLNLADLVICYGDHVGHPGLRKIIAYEANQTSGSSSITEKDVLITAGAATALFIVSTSLLEKGDGLLVMRPNYATNIETPRAIGAEISFLDLKIEEDWRVDFAKLEKMITPKTKLVSLTCPHNPTGTMMGIEELKKVITLVESKGCKFLYDETYRDMTFGKILPVAATLSNSAISVCSLSKTYGLPGIRTGWMITQDEVLFEKFLAAKEQIMICNSVIDEEIAFRYLQMKEKYLPAIKSKIVKHFEIVKHWIAQESKMEWVEPSGGVVCFPRIKLDSKVDVNRFYQILNDKYGTFVGPGHWFEMDRRFMRIGYGWPKTEELKEGLAAISSALGEVLT